MEPKKSEEIIFNNDLDGAKEEILSRLANMLKGSNFLLFCVAETEHGIEKLACHSSDITPPVFATYALETPNFMNKVVKRKLAEVEKAANQPEPTTH